MCLLCGIRQECMWGCSHSLRHTHTHARTHTLLDDDTHTHMHTHAHTHTHTLQLTSITNPRPCVLLCTGCSQGPLYTECPGRQQHAGQSVQLQQQESGEGEITSALGSEYACDSVCVMVPFLSVVPATKLLQMDGS